MLNELTPEALAAIAFAVGALLSAVLSWALLRQRSAVIVAKKDSELAVAAERLARLERSESELQEAQAAAGELRSRLSAADAQRTAEAAGAAEKLTLLEDAHTRLQKTFEALSADALRRNNTSFLELARETLEKFQSGAQADLDKRQLAIDNLVKPVRETLDKVGTKIGEIETARVGAYESISAHLKMMSEAQGQLRSETANLVKALRSPVARGRWGEIQLRRVVEMAGMLEHCDFDEQESVTTETGRLRPDMLVRLPGGKNIVVDAKAPLGAYLDALETSDEAERLVHMKAHARQVRQHIEALTRRAYWEQFRPAPEFVVLFLPGETFFSAALEHDPGLIEYGADKRVILATPTTLIALLRAVFYGWRQEKLAQNAEEISELGRELFKRIADMGGHMNRLGRNLNSAVEGYNSAVGTLESRVLVTARKFRDLEAAPEGAEVPELSPVDQVSRKLQAPELLSREEEA